MDQKVVDRALIIHEESLLVQNEEKKDETQAGMDILSSIKDVL